MKSAISVGIAVISGFLLICHFSTFVSCQSNCEEPCTLNGDTDECICPEENAQNLSLTGNDRDKRSSSCGHYNRVCRSRGDPHIWTFQEIYRNFYNLGVYTLLRYDNRALWIQVRQVSCGSRASCTCGLMVREGNSIISISKCKPLSNPRLVKYELKPGAQSGTVYKTREGGWKISLVSGVMIEITIWNRDYLDVSVTGLKSEYWRYKGLCSGNFRRGGRVSRRDNFFNIFTSGTNLPCRRNQITPSCKCFGGTTDCVDPRSEKPEIISLQCGILKREIGDADDDSKSEDNTSTDVSEVVARELNMGYRFFERVRDLSPSLVLSVEDVRSRCTDALRLTPTYELCSGRVDTSAIVNTCVLDVQLMNDYGPTKSVPTEFEVACLDNIRLSIEAGTSSANLQELKELRTNVEKLVCPSQCSQKGRCVDSKCQCNEGFMGTDCSLRIGQVPVVQRIITPVCDIRKQPCKEIHVVASDLTNPENVVCKMRSVDVSDSAVPAVQFSTPEISDNLVRCNLPQTTVSINESTNGISTTVFRVQVSISNDGQTYSQELPYTVFDGNCMECPATQDTPCQLKTNTCSIGGRCYKAEDSCSQDAARICNPAKCTTKWTGESSTNCEDGSENCT